MSDLEKTEREIESLGDSLASLERVSFRSGVEFKGLFKEVTDAANSLSSAGKKWTIFSRLVSGTPLWKVQNYLRGALGILSEFSIASQENAKARNKQNDSIVKNIKNYDTLNTAMKDTMLAYDNYRKGIAEEADMNVLKEQIQDTAAFQIALKATGDEAYAMAKAYNSVSEKHKQMRKEEEDVIKMAKKAHAFDKDRLVLAEKAARKKSKERGFGEKQTELEVKDAVKREKRKMSEEQAGISKDSMKEGFESLKKSFFDPKQFKALALPFAPLMGMYKLAKNRKKYQQMILDFNELMQQKILPNLQKMILFVIFGAIAFLLFVRAAYEIFKVLEEMGLIADIKDFVIGVFGVVMDLFKIAFAFISGDYEKAFALIPPMLDKVQGLLIDGGKLLVALAWTTLTAGFGLIIEFFNKMFTEPTFAAAVIEYAVQAGMLVAGVWMAKTLIAMALQLLATYALPLAVFVLVAAFLVALYTQYKEEINDLLLKIIREPVEFVAKLLNYMTNGDFFSDILSTLQDFAKSFVFKVSLVKGAKKFFGKVKDRVSSSLSKSMSSKKIKGAFASGGIVSASGLQLVGERGPELVKLPAGSRVHNSSDSMKMGDTNINITINAKDTSDAELRRIADQVGNMITNKINRSFSSSGFVR